MFKKVFVIFWFSFCLVLITVLVMGGGVGVVEVAEARSGCCSAHSGVCGCSCCDGSRLSAVCGQYYPECEVDSFGHDRAEMKPNKNTANGDDRHILSQNKKDDGWILALTYAFGVSLFLFFVKMRYKIK